MSKGRYDILHGLLDTYSENGSKIELVELDGGTMKRYGIGLGLGPSSVHRDFDRWLGGDAYGDRIEEHFIDMVGALACEADYIKNTSHIKYAVVIMRVRAAQMYYMANAPEENIVLEKHKKAMQSLVDAMASRIATQGKDTQGWIEWNIEIVVKGLELTDPLKKVQAAQWPAGNAGIGVAGGRVPDQSKKESPLSYANFNKFMDRVVAKAKEKIENKALKKKCQKGPITSLHFMIETIVEMAYEGNTNEEQRTKLRETLWSHIGVTGNHLDDVLIKGIVDQSTVITEYSGTISEAVAALDANAQGDAIRHLIKKQKENNKDSKEPLKMLEFMEMLSQMPEGKHTANLWKRGIYLTVMTLLLTCVGGLVGGAVHLAIEHVAVQQALDAGALNSPKMFFEKLWSVLEQNNPQALILVCVLASVGGLGMLFGMIGNSNSPMYAVGGTELIRDNLDTILEDTLKEIAKEASKGLEEAQGSGRSKSESDSDDSSSGDSWS